MSPGTAKETVRKPAIELECDPRLVFYSNRNGVTMRNKVGCSCCRRQRVYCACSSGQFFHIGQNEPYGRGTRNVGRSPGRIHPERPSGISK